MKRKKFPPAKSGRVAVRVNFSVESWRESFDDEIERDAVGCVPSFRVRRIIRVRDVVRKLVSSRRNGTEYLCERAGMSVPQLRNPFDTIRLPDAKPKPSREGMAVFLCEIATDPRSLVYVRAIRVFVPFSSDQYHDATYAPSRFYPKERKIERWKGRSARKAADGNISANPRTHTRRSFRKSSSPRASCTLWKLERGEMEKTLIRGGAPTRQSRHAIIRDARAQLYGSPDSRYGTKCPRAGAGSSSFRSTNARVTKVS